MAKGMSKDKLLNREIGSSNGAGMKVKAGDAGREGYLASDFGGNENDNYRIADGYQSKDESPSRSEDSNVKEIAHHSVTGELYSGDPEGHGHKNKVAAVYKAGAAGTSSPKMHKGGADVSEE
jgi:hypothetical protein